MEIKVNVPLIDKISTLFSKSAPPIRKREETTETSVEAGIISYYYQKVKLERTRLAKYGDAPPHIILPNTLPNCSPFVV